VILGHKSADPVEVTPGTNGQFSTSKFFKNSNQANTSPTKKYYGHKPSFTGKTLDLTEPIKSNFEVDKNMYSQFFLCKRDTLGERIVESPAQGFGKNRRKGTSDISPVSPNRRQNSKTKTDASYCDKLLFKKVMYGLGYTKFDRTHLNDSSLTAMDPNQICPVVKFFVKISISKFPSWDWSWLKSWVPPFITSNRWPIFPEVTWRIRGPPSPYPRYPPTLREIAILPRQTFPSFFIQ
jgi:hypothetical protein